MSRLLFLGDSLMQENGPDTYPQTGWPQALKEFLRDPDTPILDFAKNIEDDMQVDRSVC